MCIRDRREKVLRKTSLYKKELIIYPLHIMKVVSSLKSLKKRDLNNKLVKRRGKLYVINKKNPRMKARQG